MKKLCIILFLAFSCIVAQAQSYELIGTLTEHEYPVQNLSFSPDGEMLVSGDREGNVMLWSVSDQKLLRKWKGHESIVVDFDFSPFGSKLATASTDGSVKVWDLMDGSLLGTYYNRKTALAGEEIGWALSFAVFSHDGRFVYFGGDGATIFRARLGRNLKGELHKEEVVYSYPIKHFDRDKMQRITGGELMPSGRALVCTIGYYVKIIRLIDGAEIKSMYYSREPLNDVVVGPKAGQISTWSFDGNATIWNAMTGDIVREYAAGDYLEICSPSFSMDKGYMATAASGHEAHVWDLYKHEKVATLLGHSEIVRIAKFSPRANLIATASFDGTVKLWEGPEMPMPEEEYETEIFEAYNGDSLLNPEDIDLPMLFFDQSQYVLRRESRIALRRVAAAMKHHEDLQLQVEGHTDNVGNPYKNVRLSERRAMVVRNYLIEQGVPETRIHIAGSGGDQPVFLNTSEASKSKNRRVELSFVKTAVADAGKM